MAPSHGVCELIIICGNQNHCTFSSTVLLSPEKMYYTINFSEENFDSAAQAYFGYNFLLILNIACIT